jgi:hypothetical protein
MIHEGQLQIFIYKRTHSGDPDPRTGVFGNNDCMGRDRGWQYDAVIGIGGVGAEPRRHGIAKKLTWIGIGPHQNKTASLRGPRVTFDHFLYYGDKGPMLENLAPALAKRMYRETNVRSIMSRSLSEEARLEAEIILRAAFKAPSSGEITGRRQLDSRRTSCKSRLSSCRRII